MRYKILLLLVFSLIPIIINGQTQEATTSYGKEVILNADGTWKYTEVKNDSRMTGGTGSGSENSGNSYAFQGREIQKLPKPKYNYQETGSVVVEVSVDRTGKVIQAVPGIKGSTTLDVSLLNAAKDAAMEAIFEAKQDAPAIQKGTITYNFILK